MSDVARDSISKKTNVPKLRQVELGLSCLTSRTSSLWRPKKSRAHTMVSQTTFGRIENRTENTHKMLWQSGAPFIGKPKVSIFLRARRTAEATTTVAILWPCQTRRPTLPLFAVASSVTVRPAVVREASSTEET